MIDGNIFIAFYRIRTTVVITIQIQVIRNTVSIRIKIQRNLARDVETYTVVGTFSSCRGCKSEMYGDRPYESCYSCYTARTRYSRVMNRYTIKGIRDVAAVCIPEYYYSMPQTIIYPAVSQLCITSQFFPTCRLGTCCLSYTSEIKTRIAIPSIVIIIITTVWKCIQFKCDTIINTSCSQALSIMP